MFYATCELTLPARMCGTKQKLIDIRVFLYRLLLYRELIKIVKCWIFQLIFKLIYVNFFTQCFFLSWRVFLNPL